MFARKLNFSLCAIKKSAIIISNPKIAFNFNHSTKMDVKWRECIFAFSLCHMHVNNNILRYVIVFFEALLLLFCFWFGNYSCLRAFLFSRSLHVLWLYLIIVNYYAFDQVCLFWLLFCSTVYTHICIKTITCHRLV